MNINNNSATLTHQNIKRSISQQSSINKNQQLITQLLQNNNNNNVTNSQFETVKFFLRPVSTIFSYFSSL
jgi:hypothetical protein